MTDARLPIRVAALAIVLLVCANSVSADSLVGSRPNIILVMTDDQGLGDLSCMGNQVLRTPNIDRFYRDATRFTDFHVSLYPTLRDLAGVSLPGDVQHLYNIENDPSETRDVANEHPEVVDRLRQAYNRWWDSTLPLLVNEGLPRVSPEQQPFALRYAKQLNQRGIPNWMPDEL